MTNSGKLVAFIVVIAGAFVYICHAIPQVKSQPVGAETEIGDSLLAYLVAQKVDKK